MILAARGPSTDVKRVMAQTNKKGAVKGAGSSKAPVMAATPKIRIGITSGKTSTEISMPPRGSFTDTAAPTVPMNEIAGVPASSVTMVAPMPSRERFNIMPKSGVASTSGKPVIIQ